MSLINQVLKDLEKRHADAADGRGLARAVRPLPLERPRRLMWILTGLAAVAIVAGASWWRYLNQSSPSTPPSPVARTTAAPAAIASSVTGLGLAPSAVPLPSIPSELATPGLSDSTPLSTKRQRDEIASAASNPGVVTAIPSSPVAHKSASNVPAVTPAPGLVSPPAALKVPASSATATVEEVNPSEASRPSPPARKTAVRPSERESLDESAATLAPAGEYSDHESEPLPPGIEKQVKLPSQHERAEADFREGMAVLRSGDQAHAEALFKRALDSEPLADKARQALLGMFMEGGRRTDAERLLEERLQLDRTPAGFALALARLQLERGANDDALITLQRSLPFGEASPDYQAMLANSLSRVGQHKEAADSYATAARLAPRNPLWYMGLGMELRAQNRPVEARAAFQRAQELGGLNSQLASFVQQQLTELR